MFIWKYIDINPDIVTELQNRYMKVLPTNDHFFQVVDLDVDEFLGLEIFRPVLIQVAPHAVGRIHADFRPSGDQLALNIPLENCEDSITNIWASSYEPPVQFTDNGQPYRYFDPLHCTKIAEFKVTRPVIFRTDLPHSVSNTSNKVRRAISIRFKKDPWHLVGMS